MAETKFKKVTKEELVSLIDRQIRNSVGYYDSKLSKERETVLDYYNAVLPKPHHTGNSKYVSMDVFDSVESLKAVLLETFAAGNRIVTFDPQNEEDVEPARIATEYCDYVLFRKNDGYQIFHDVIHDGLTARVGVAKVYWQDYEEDQDETFEGLVQEEIDALMARDDIEITALDVNPETGLFEGEVVRRYDKGKICINVIPPEEFLITPQATSIEDAPFVAHRSRKSYSELIEMGYDRKLVMSIGAEDESELSLHPEVLARFDDIGADRLNLNGEVQEQAKKVVVYECYTHLDVEGDGTTRLYKVMRSGNIILDYEQVDKKPFIAFVPITTPHSFYGSNYASRVIPTQNARTTLVRGILDHTVITNNPRYQVVKGALTNPKELIENRVGGLVNVTRPDGILPLPQAGLNPFVFQTIQLLDADKEEATGVSQLSQGLNKDAVSKQNSQGLVENLVTLSQQRQKIIARNFANQFIKPLYLEIYRLTVAHQSAQEVIKVAGNFMRVLPSDWEERTDAIIELKLGYGEQEREAEKYLAMHQLLSQDPGVGEMYSAKNRFAMLKAVFEKSGVKNVTEYLTPPEMLPPPQPDPMMMKQVELEERKVGVQEKQAEVSMTKVQVNAELDSMKLELQKMAHELNVMKAERSEERKDFDSAARYAIATEELEMAKATPQDQRNAIISPNS
jgi:hypothetical protein